MRTKRLGVQGGVIVRLYFHFVHQDLDHHAVRGLPDGRDRDIGRRDDAWKSTGSKYKQEEADQIFQKLLLALLLGQISSGVR